MIRTRDAIAFTRGDGEYRRGQSRAAGFPNQIGVREVRPSRGVLQREDAHAGALPGLHSCRGIFDDEGLRGFDRVALAQQKSQPPQSRDETVGRRLAMLDVFGGDDIEEQIANTGAAQNHFGLIAQRAGHEHQGEARRALAHELGRARIHHIAIANHFLVDRGLARDQVLDVRRARILADFLEHGLEAVVVVESNQARKILLARKLDAFGAQRLGKTDEMKRLGIGQRAVEVEKESCESC